MKETYLSTISGERTDPASRCLRGGLLVLSRGYRGVLAAKKSLYASGFISAARLKVPVISVGNLTWGGTGKTPFVIEICGRIGALGLKPAVLLRGYGADESRQLAAALPGVPIGVGADRAASARSILDREAVDVFILDDAFQHWALARDWDVVLVNATAPFGNGFLIPRGELREPPSELKRAQAVVLTHADRIPPAELEALREKIGALAPQAVLAEAVHRPDSLWRPKVSVEGEKLSVNALLGKSVVAVSGIAGPGSFAKTLKGLGADIKQTFEYGDHHPFTAEEIRAVRVWADENESVVVTTEKDFFRCRELFLREADPWVLKIRLQLVKGGEQIMKGLETLFGMRGEPSRV
jgi:tetraacyldisaccharide 4'-kinase